MTDEDRLAIATIAEALRDKFGDRAEIVARSQAAAAQGDARRTWSAIVAYFEAQ